MKLVRADQHELMASTDHGGLQVIPEDECLRLLGGATLGRVALSIGALPVVLPVNFAMDDGDVVLRTNKGTKLNAALAGAVVAFEADEYDAVYHTGWSVLVTGVARVVTLPDELSRLKELPLRPWAPGERDDYVRIARHTVTGRRIGSPVLPPRHLSHP
jgi:nitroimidazol reductase NimA-like FMN-containing flavoprotein (pyridoxamine 5'-phosphate oxidase superfamily)